MVLASILFVTLSSLAATVAAAPSLDLIKKEQTTCTLQGWSGYSPPSGIGGGKVSPNPLVKKQGSTGSVRRGFELFVDNEVVWSCGSVGWCNPKSMKGQKFTGDLTGMVTDVEWKTNGNLGNECSCVVDGVEHPSTVGGDVEASSYSDTCPCSFPCDTGCANVAEMSFFDQTDFNGRGQKFRSKPDVCCTLLRLLLQIENRRVKWGNS
jgi:hypothetical protein